MRFNKLFLQPILYSLILLAAFLFALFWIYGQQVRIETRSLIENEEAGIDVVNHMIVQDFNEVFQDLIQIAEDNLILDALSANDTKNNVKIAEKLQNIVEVRRIYREARLIDKTGMELIRVDSNKESTVTKSDEELQNKSDRYYFIETMALKQREVYMSVFDLNVEYGIIEEPFVPTIRLSTPVYSSREETPSGMVILNYEGQSILDEVGHETEKRPGTFLLLNSDGFFLKGLSADDEWGFQIKGREKKTFQNQFPEIWEQINTVSSGHIQNDRGIFLFKTIDLKKETISILNNERYLNNYDILIDKQNSLILVSYISDESLKKLIYEKLSPLLFILVCVGVGVFFAIIVSVIIIISYRSKFLKTLESTRQMALFPAYNPGPVAQLNIEGKVTLSNKMFTDILEFDPLGHYWAEISQKFTVSRPRNTNSRGDEIKRIHQEEWTIGNETFLFSYKRDEDGENVYIYGIDISELNQITRDLRQSERKFRGIFNQSLQSVVLLDSEGIVLQANETCLKNIQIQESELLGCPFWKIPMWNHSKDLSEKIKDAMNASAKGEFIRLNVEYPDQHGEIRYLDFSLKPIVDDSGNVLYQISEWRDISDFIRIDAEAKKLALVVEKTANGVVITDPNGRVEWVNHGFEMITGYSLEELKGKIPGRVLQGRETNKNTVRQIHDALSKQVDIQVEIINYSKNGDSYWLELYIEPVFNDDGILQKYIAIETDISERKQIADELVKAKKEAEQASNAKSDFLANMSHEIRTPMNAIIGMGHLVRQTDLSPRQSDYLEKIEISSKALLGIINDILDFSKIEAGKLVIENVPFDLSDILQETIILNADKAGEKGLELIIDMDNSIPPMLSGDPVRINQILTNLLNNAIKFTAEGEIELSIEIIKKFSDSLLLEFSVTDTGIGMNEKQISTLFQKFTQADTSTTRKYGGTGLGLSICRQLVELMGGEIRIESRTNIGSKFIFTLTLGIIKEEEEAKLIPLLPLDFRNLKVLLLATNAKSSAFLEKQLRALSFSVESCSDLKSFEKELKYSTESYKPFELVISDFHIIKEGLYLLPEIKGSKIPLIIMANINDIIDAEDLTKDQLMTEVVQKPLTSSQLFNGIMNVFGHANLIDQNRVRLKQESRKILKHRSSSILLVEDNKINQQVASELLKETEVKLSIVNNGKEAVDAVIEKDFDLVLMDIQMPVMDGMEATKEIRKLKSAKKNTTIIAMTARAMAGDREEFLQAGINDYISKPIDPEKLYSTISKWLKSDKDIDHRKVESFAHVKPVDFSFSIPGIDIHEGLKHVDGNKSLYLDLLRDFINENKDFVLKVSSSLKQGDYKTARRHAHTLRGVAGTLGAVNLQKMSQQLENDIVSQKIEVQDILDKIEKYLEAIIMDVITVLQGNHDENHLDVESSTDDSKWEMARIQELIKLLTENDMQALEVFDEIKNNIIKKDNRLAEVLKQKLGSLSFPEALEILRRIYKL